MWQFSNSVSKGEKLDEHIYLMRRYICFVYDTHTSSIREPLRGDARNLQGKARLISSFIHCCSVVRST